MKPKPTVGRIINYWPMTFERRWPHEQPLAAIITHVWSDTCVNLAIHHEDGTGVFSRTSVPLKGADDRPQPGECSWMAVQHQTTAILAKTGQMLDAATAVAETSKSAQRLDHPLDHIARVCHEANRAYCEALGDFSQPSWDAAPVWQRQSARMGVELHMSGNFGPEASHRAWMQHKLDDGWTYAPVKNAEAKEHHCLVPFDQLPREQQAKDYIFRAIVHAMR